MAEYTLTVSVESDLSEADEFSAVHQASDSIARSLLGLLSVRVATVAVELPAGAGPELEE